MLVYWEKNASGVYKANFDTEENDERCQVQKPQMQNDEDKKQITNSTMNIVFIFDLQKNNNFINVGFEM
jgi:hypothetical protein